jgi:hypothetical protein
VHDKNIGRGSLFLKEPAEGMNKMEKYKMMIYWKGEQFWLGKLMEYPEIMT